MAKKGTTSNRQGDSLIEESDDLEGEELNDLQEHLDRVQRATERHRSDQQQQLNDAMENKKLLEFDCAGYQELLQEDRFIELNISHIDMICELYERSEMKNSIFADLANGQYKDAERAAYDSAGFLRKCTNTPEELKVAKERNPKYKTAREEWIDMLTDNHGRAAKFYATGILDRTGTKLLAINCMFTPPYGDEERMNRHEQEMVDFLTNNGGEEFTFTAEENFTMVDDLSKEELREVARNMAEWYITCGSPDPEARGAPCVNYWKMIVQKMVTENLPISYVILMHYHSLKLRLPKRTDEPVAMSSPNNPSHTFCFKRHFRDFGKFRNMREEIIRTVDVELRGDEDRTTRDIVSAASPLWQCKMGSRKDVIDGAYETFEELRAKNMAARREQGLNEGT